MDDSLSGCFFCISAVEFHLSVIVYPRKSFGIHNFAARLCLDDAAQTEETAAPDVPADPTPKAGEADEDPEVGEKTEVKKNLFSLSLSCFFCCLSNQLSKSTTTNK